MMTDKLCYASALELGRLFRRREVSAFEIVTAVLERIERLEPTINAYITVVPERALAAARRADAELAQSHDRGPLHGIPLAVKDLYDTAGIRATAGSKILSENIPDSDATTVAKLRAAGAIIVGKTNLNEFGCGVTTTNAHYGDTCNPWDLARTPGGSSGGSGAALAAGLCTIATGTDTGGSIRIPAALCGVVGMKPSYGRMSCQGIMPLSWEQDHPGPMARTVYDAAVMLQVMSGWDAADPASARVPVPDYVDHLDAGIEGRRIGVDRDYVGRDVTAEVQQAFEAALEVLHGVGAQIVDVSVPRLGEGLSAGLTMWRAEAGAVHEDWVRTRGEDYDPPVRRRLEAALTATGAEVARALRLRRQLGQDLQTLFQGVDLFATPTCAVAAPVHGASHVIAGGREYEVLAGFTRFSRVFNLTGSPAISIPCGLSSGGMPIGLQLVGPMFDEMVVLQAAQAFEQATDWHERRPSLVLPGL